jgi:hypothetical protein
VAGKKPEHLLEHLTTNHLKRALATPVKAVPKPTMPPKPTPKPKTD